MRVWLTVDGEIRTLLRQSQDMPFRTREYAHRNLVTKFSMEPAQTSVLWINYSSPGSTALPVNIETEASFVQRSLSRESKSAIFYALMMLFIVVASLSYFPFRYSIFPIYVLYATTVLLYVMHRDGFAFQYFWPWFPNFNSFVSLPLGAGLALFGILFSRQYLRTKTSYPKADRLLTAFALMSLLFIPYGLLVDEQSAKQMSTVWALVVAITLLALGVRSWIDHGNRMLFFVAGWFGVVGASVVMVLGSLFGREIDRETTLDAIRLAMVFDAVMMGFAMAEHVLQIRRERDVALDRNIRSLQRNLDLHERLNKLEGRYSEALEVARKSDKVLADATHDIRQPLFALRSSLKSITRERNSESLASASRSLLYLEKLVDEYLEQALAGDPGAGDHSDARSGPGVPVGIVFTTVTDMFKDDAIARGLQLRVRPSNVRMNADPMVISRIVSNFVANAVHYTDTGGVLVGVKKRHGRAFIAVYDTGPGISDEILEQVIRRGERADPSDSPGKGLGLDIALSLAKQHGLATIINSRPGSGSLFAVAIRSKNW